MSVMAVHSRTVTAEMSPLHVALSSPALPQITAVLVTRLVVPPAGVLALHKVPRCSVDAGWPVQQSQFVSSCRSVLAVREPPVNRWATVMGWKCAVVVTLPGVVASSA